MWYDRKYHKDFIAKGTVIDIESNDPTLIRYDGKTIAILSFTDDDDFIDLYIDYGDDTELIHLQEEQGDDAPSKIQLIKRHNIRKEVNNSDNIQSSTGTIPV